ncbi:hypothetical protein BJ546DRAFT_1058713 [Cryomyces antarcticus]
MADLQRNEPLEQELGSHADFFECNVADYDSQADMFQAVWVKHGRIDALCANAGIVDRSSLYILDYRNSEEIPPKPDTLCTDVDYKGVLYGTQLAIHFMRRNPTPGGCIVATASVAALYPHPSYPEYCGAKAAVMNFVRCVAPVLKVKENIRINAVLPGIVPTKILPQAMIDAVAPECLTPVSTITAAYNMFLEDESLTGQAVECSANKHLFSHQPEFLDGAISKRAVTCWDPLFKMLHYEDSGLPDAIP